MQNLSPPHAQDELNVSTANATINSSAKTAKLGWGLFWLIFCSHAGTLLLIAATICFCAYNWHIIPAYGKFAGISILMIVAAVIACWRGLHSTIGGLALLACALLAGPLMAVFGQVYQTGADSWELFRAWAVFIAPLAIIGRRSGLWAALWAIVTLWAVLYAGQETTNRYAPMLFDNMILYIVAAQVVALSLWELAARFFAGPKRPYLAARWLPTCVCFAIVIWLTTVLVAGILGIRGSDIHFTGSWCLYAYLIFAGEIWYTRERLSVFLVACGMASLICIVLTWELSSLEMSGGFYDNYMGLAIIMLITLIGCATAAGKLLFHLHRRTARKVGKPGQKEVEPTCAPCERSERRISLNDTPDGSPSAAFFLAKLHFALTGRVAGNTDGASEISNQKMHSANKDSHWAGNALMTLCACIAVPLVIFLCSLIVAPTFGEVSFFLLFLGSLGLGTFLSHRPGFLRRQVSLCFCFTGLIGSSVLAPDLLNLDYWFLLPILLCLMISGFFSGDRTYRLIAATLFIVLAFGQLMRCAYSLDIARSEQEFYDSAWQHTHMIQRSLSGIVSALFCACLAVLATRPRASFSSRREIWLPAGFAALLLLSVTLIVNKLYSFFRAREFLESEWVAYLDPIALWFGAGVGLVVLAFRLRKDLDLSVSSLSAIVFLCIAVAGIGNVLPWLPAGLFALALARQQGSLAMVGAALLFIVLNTVLEYYFLGTSLINKALFMGAPGLLFLLISGLINWRLTAARGSANLAGQGILRMAHEPGVLSCESPGSKAPCVVLVASLALFLLFFAWAVRGKEALLANGETMVLSLRPLDPRSLMQGDYMILSFAVEDEISRMLGTGWKYSARAPELSVKGTARMKRDKNGVFHVECLDGIAGQSQSGDNTEGTVDSAGFWPLTYRIRGRGIQICSGSFLFQEGHGTAYDEARFAELRVDADGTCIITHLLDKNMERINPEEMNQ